MKISATIFLVMALMLPASLRATSGLQLPSRVAQEKLSTVEYEYYWMNLPSLIGAWMYCEDVERQLNLIQQHYPALQEEVRAVDASWNASPLAQGGKGIHDSISDIVGKEAASAVLEKHQAERMPEVPVSEAEARIYLSQLLKRAKGEPDSSGDYKKYRRYLLTYCPRYRDHPELEIRDGYTQQASFRLKDETMIQVSVPMSWSGPLEMAKNSEGNGLAFQARGYESREVSLFVMASDHPDIGDSPQARRDLMASEQKRLTGMNQGEDTTLLSCSLKHASTLEGVFYTSVRKLDGVTTASAEVGFHTFTRQQGILIALVTEKKEGPVVAEATMRKNLKLFDEMVNALRIVTVESK